MTLKHSFVRSPLSAVAAAVMAATLTLAAEAAQSASALGLSESNTAAAASATARPSGVLPPATRRTKPFRKALTGTCENSVCRFVFPRVRNNKLLRIDNVSCLGLVSAENPSRYAVLSTAEDLGDAGLIATLPSTQITASNSGLIFVVNASGPYFFRGGETVHIVSGGSQGRCTISGYLSRTD